MTTLSPSSKLFSRSRLCPAWNWSKVPPVATVLYFLSDMALLHHALGPSGRVADNKGQVENRSEMRVPEQYSKAGKIVREMREWVVENVSVPQTYLEIATMVEDEIVRRGGQPAFPTGIG